MEPKLKQFILKYSGQEQVKVLLLTLLIFPVLYFSLELPKMIINEAIDSKADKDIFGITLDPINFLLILCGVLLITVLINGAFKMRINTFKGIIGERMVRRLRYQLISQFLRFPPTRFQRISQGEIIATVTSETEPLAGFIGDSLAQPLFQGGTMLTILIFMFMQDPVLGMVSISMIPLQAYIIPKMQKKLNQLKKQRVKEVRFFSGQIGEAVDGNREIKLQGTQRYHLAHFSHTLGRLFKIRFEIFKHKFLMKFINNFLNQLPPILFYAVGGILVIKGQLTIGALVAALAAFKDLVSPWKELLAYYQQYQDSKIRYEYIQEQFNPEDLINTVPKTPDNLPDFSAALQLHNLYLKNDRGDYISQNINLDILPGTHISIFSQSEVMLRKLAMNIVKLEPIATGDIRIGSSSIKNLASQVLSHQITYIGPEPFLIEGTILQNINYGLRRSPPQHNLSLLSPVQLEALNESRASGNSDESIDDIWTDFNMAGVDGWIKLSLWLQDIMSAIGARRIVFEFGLKDYIDPLAIAPTIHDKFSITKEDLFTNLRGVEADELIERFNIKGYSEHLSIIENIAFGLIDRQDEHQTLEVISNYPKFSRMLRDRGLYKTLRDLGEKLAYHVINQLEDLGPNEQLNHHYRLYDTECIRKQLSTCLMGPEHSPSCEFLLSMALSLRVSVHGKSWVSSALKEQILELRQQLIRSPIGILSDYFEPLRKGRMNQRLTVMENLLWGFERAPENYNQKQKLIDIVELALIENEAEALVLILISLSKVGIRGERLSQINKQHIQLMRVLIKRPKILLMHNALPSKNVDQINKLLAGIKDILPDTTVIMFSSQKRVTAKHVDYYQLDLQGIKKQPWVSLDKSDVT